MKPTTLKTIRFVCGVIIVLIATYANVINKNLDQNTMQTIILYTFSVILMDIKGDN